MDKPRPTALCRLIEVADNAAAHHANPLARFSTVLTDITASSADPYLIIESLLDGIALVIAARIPLDRQREIACQVEVRLFEVLVAWELK